MHVHVQKSLWVGVCIGILGLIVGYGSVLARQGDLFTATAQVRCAAHQLTGHSA